MTMEQSIAELKLLMAKNPKSQDDLIGYLLLLDNAVVEYGFDPAFLNQYYQMLKGINPATLSIENVASLQQIVKDFQWQTHFTGYFATLTLLFLLRHLAKTQNQANAVLPQVQELNLSKTILLNKEDCTFIKERIDSVKSSAFQPNAFLTQLNLIYGCMHLYFVLLNELVKKNLSAEVLTLLRELNVAQMMDSHQMSPQVAKDYFALLTQLTHQGLHQDVLNLLEQTTPCGVQQQGQTLSCLMAYNNALSPKSWPTTLAYLKLQDALLEQSQTASTVFRLLAQLVVGPYDFTTNPPNLFIRYDLATHIDPQASTQYRTVFLKAFTQLLDSDPNVNLGDYACFNETVKQGLLALPAHQDSLTLLYRCGDVTQPSKLAQYCYASTRFGVTQALSREGKTALVCAIAQKIADVRQALGLDTLQPVPASLSTMPAVRPKIACDFSVGPGVSVEMRLRQNNQLVDGCS